MREEDEELVGGTPFTPEQTLKTFYVCTITVDDRAEHLEDATLRFQFGSTHGILNEYLQGVETDWHGEPIEFYMG